VAVSDTIIEPRTFPIPVGVQTTDDPDRNDVFGKNDSLVVAQTFIVGASLLKGSTAYKPPDVEYRIALAFQANYVDVPEKRVLFVEPSKGTDRFDFSVGVQEFFVDYHLRNVSDRFDFDSVRVGIQPFQFDFRGFLFQDQQLGIRLFGNRDNNRFQYNLIAAVQVEKDTNSGLNDVTEMPRQSYIFHGNVFRQDFPVVGLTSMASITYNMNRERGDVEIDDNGFPVRPALLGNLRARNYDVVYLGYGIDGRIGRMNISAQAYGAFGEDRNNIFTSKPANIRSYFFAAEPSYDIDWIRLRGAVLYASGDGKPFNNTQGRLRCDLREPDLCRCRHQLLDPPVDPVCGRWARRVDQRPQRHPELAAIVQGRGPVQLRQSGHRAARRRRGLRHHPRIPDVGKRQSSVVRQDAGARSIARRRLDPERDRLRSQRGGDLPAQIHPEPGVSPVRRGVGERRRVQGPVCQFRPGQTIHFGPVQRDPDILI
jgi:hypothetical protein